MTRKRGWGQRRVSVETSCDWDKFGRAGIWHSWCYSGTLKMLQKSQIVVSFHMFAVEHSMSFTERRKSNFRSLQRAEDNGVLASIFRKRFEKRIIFILSSVGADTSAHLRRKGEWRTDWPWSHLPMNMQSLSVLHCFDQTFPTCEMKTNTANKQHWC